MSKVSASNLYKPCTSCGEQRHVSTTICKHCGAKYPRKMGAKKTKATQDDPVNTTFAAGLALDGSLFLMWPRENSCQGLTIEETAIVRRVLAAPRAE